MSWFWYLVDLWGAFWSSLKKFNQQRQNSNPQPPAPNGNHNGNQNGNGNGDTIPPAEETSKEDINTLGQKLGYALIIGLFLILPLVFSFLYWEPVAPGKDGHNYGLIILAATVAYAILSFKVINPDRQVLIVFLGKPLFEASGTMVFVPFILGEVFDFPTTVQQIELPGEPEQIFDESYPDEKDENGKIKKGKEKPLPAELTSRGKPHVRPIRVTFNDEDPEGKNEDGRMRPSATQGDTKNGEKDPLRRRVTTTLSFVLPFQVIDPSNAFVTFGNLEEIKRQLGDYATSELVSLLQVGTLARANNNLDILGRMAKENLFKFLQDKHPTKKGGTKEWGIHIYDLKLKPFGLGHDLNVKMQAIAESIALAEARKNEGAGEKVYLTEQGAGKANARKAILLAEADGIKEMEKLNANGREVLAIEAVKTGLASGNHVILGGSGSLQGLVAELAATGKVVAKGMEKKPEDEQI
ncbi:MAG: hypothetical protein KBC48_02650 [Candidatus Pacebacteria bacterium]|nr:hypothetical protein [Candidatus Paceibacterota bacterium]